MVERTNERVDSLLDRITSRIQGTLRDLRRRPAGPGLEDAFEPGAEALLDETLQERKDRSR